MEKLSPAEAADTIRADFQSEPGEPGYLHRFRFAEQVCDHLGTTRAHENTERVLKLLAKHDIDGSAYEAFPGWFENDLGERARCEDEAGRDAFMSRERDEDGLIGPDQGTVDAHGKFTIVAGIRKRDIRATMPRYSDEKDIEEVGETDNGGAPLHRLHDLGDGEPISQRPDHMPDPDSLMLNPPNPVDPTHDNRAYPGDNPAHPDDGQNRTVEHEAPRGPVPAVKHDANLVT